MSAATASVVPSGWADRELRDVLGHLPTGVSVVAGLDEAGRPGGLAVGSFTSVSLNPPLVAFLVAETSSSWPLIRGAARFSVSVLSHDQEHVCRALAAKGTNKFDNLSWTPSPASGAPQLAGAHAWVDIELEREVVIGDHTLVVGTVIGLAIPGSEAPLVFYRGGYHRVPIEGGGM